MTPLSDLKVEQGDTFRLEVTVSGNPLPDIHWFLDDQPVSLSDTLSVAFDGRKVRAIYSKLLNMFILIICTPVEMILTISNEYMYAN